MNDPKRVRPLLIPVDDPELTTCLLWHVEPILRWEQPRVVLLQAESTDSEGRRCDRVLTRMQRLLTAGGVDAEVERVPGGLTDAVLGRITTLDPGLVLVATSQRCSALAERLLRRSSVPLLLFNPDAVASRFTRILVPTDGSDQAALVAPLVSWLGAIYGSHVVVLHVVGQADDPDEADLRPLAERFEASGLSVTPLVARSDDPADAILATAQLEQIDLVAMTTHGRSALEHWALGSVAEKVFRGCRVPLLVRRVGAPRSDPPPPSEVRKVEGWGEPPARIRGMKLRRVLLPLDGSNFSQRAVRAVPLIVRGRSAACTLLRVTPDGPLAKERVVEIRAEQETLREELSAQGWAVETRTLVGDAAQRIVAAAVEDDVDLILMATHARSGAPRWLRGSVTERVLRHSEVPVLVAPPRWLERSYWDQGGIQRVLVPFDGSEFAAAVLPLVEDLARRHHAEVVLFRVGPPLPRDLDPDLEEAHTLLRAELEPERARLSGEGIPTTVEVTRGEVVEEIVRASEDTDLVAMSTHGRSGASRWLLGSVAEGVLRSCKRPLLLVRGG